MLLDLDQPRQPLWLNAGLCLGEPGASVYGRWSGDGQFLAFVCQHDVYRARAYLIAMQTGVVQPIADAELIDLAWSPIGSHLLVTEWSGPQRNPTSSRAYVLDAAQGASVDLPVAAAFEMGGYAGVGPWRELFGGYLALMAWSPDGTQLAIVGHNAVAVADADGRNARTFPQASDPQLYQSGDWEDGGQFRRGPVWREDGEAIFVTRLVGNGRATTPSGSVGSRVAEIDLATGAVRLVDAIPTPSLDFTALPAKRPIDPRSPDGSYLVTYVSMPEDHYVVVREGQEQAALPGLRTFLGWRPAPQGDAVLMRN